MRRHITLFSWMILLICICPAWSQTPVFYEQFFENVELSVPDYATEENIVILRRHVKIELIVENDRIFQYKLMHEHLLVNQPEGVAMANRVYLPYSRNQLSEKMHVRVIHPDGRVSELDDSGILEENNEETGMTTQYFALDGLEVGAVIERIFIVKEAPELKGATVFFQSGQPVLHSQFELIYPEYLVFKSRSYNGLPEADWIDEAYGESRKSLRIRVSNLTKLPEDEQYANEVANEMQLKYKLYSSTLTNVQNLNNYTDFTTNFYAGLSPELDKKARKKLDGFLRSISTTGSQSDIVRSVEDEVKSTIKINDYAEVQSSYPDIIPTKQSTKYQLLQLYWALFHELNIPVQIVLTSKRTQVLFDKEFELISQLNNALFYFPETGNYLDPESMEYRFPLFNPTYLGTSGLFIRETQFGGVTMGVGEVRDIGIPDACISRDTMHILVDFTRDLANPKIEVTTSHEQYAAMQYQLFRDVLTPTDYDRLVSDVVENHVESCQNVRRKLSGEGIKNIGRQPFVLQVSCDGGNLVRKAGDTYLCHVGVLIGKQIEMYQVDQRMLPVDVPYPHYYYRTYDFLVPDGYEIQNPDDFRLHYVCGDPNNPTAYWDSAMEYNDGKYKATNIEYYSTLTYPLSDFEAYRKVVNAAADYNKIVIAIGKK